MNSTQKPSSRTVWIIAVAAVVALLLIVGVVAMLAARQPADQTTLPAASDQSASTKSDIKQNLSDLDKSIKQAAKDQTAAKAALKSSKTQTKVGNQ